MNFYLNLFSPRTWYLSSLIEHEISGFRKSQYSKALKINKNDILICYLVKISRFVGYFRVLEECYEDSSPIYAKEEVFTIRFKVEPFVALNPEFGLPIEEDILWQNLLWTKDRIKGSKGWAANLQQSLRRFDNQDGLLLKNELDKQKENKVKFALSKKQNHLIDIVKKPLEIDIVSISESPDEEVLVQDQNYKNHNDLNKSYRYQLKIAEIGKLLGYEIWLPKNDATILKDHLAQKEIGLIENLPSGYAGNVIKIIENIDVIWVDGSTFKRCFEIEETTAIYSGMLRMADLVSIVPNINLKIHIVADEQRREKVFENFVRPTFRKLELTKKLSYISYSAIDKLYEKEDLIYYKDEYIDNITETPDYI